MAEEIEKPVKKNKDITIINSEDKSFIQALISLSQEKRFFIKGIILGMETQKKLNETNRNTTLK